MTTSGSSNPFPGLRPFRESEAHLFFGRGDQVDELLGTLSMSRFVAVMGASGSGKSSLVAAGLLPALYGGFSRRVGSHWRIATLRPGANPTRNLALALAVPDVLAAGDRDPLDARADTEAMLRRSGLGLLDVAHASQRLEDNRLLVIVDQFEELFRFRSADAAPFVQLLLEATRDDAAPVDVVVTMRSDFLGDCSQFRDLPEAVNRGLFLVSRLTRTQLREAIVGPAAVGGATLAPRVVQRVLNDAGADPDMLPLVQHAMMRTWDTWAAEGGTGPIDVHHYEACGGLDEALSRHAEEAYFGLDGERRRAIAELMFKRITELGADRREVRRPTSVAEIAAVAEATPAEVEECVDHFAVPDTSFVARDADGMVDIAHESLIRQWPRLRGWVRDEADSRDVFRRLADAAGRWRRHEAALLHDPDLGIMRRWWTEAAPNQAWAERYDSGFDVAARYLDRSRRAARRRRVAAAAGVAALAIFAAVAVLFAFKAEHERNRAEDQTAVAQREQRGAIARQLSSSSLEAGPAARAVSLLTAIEAVRATAPDGYRVPAAEQALRQALADPLSVKLGAVQPGGEGAIEATAFSPQGSVLATGSRDGSLTLWDTAAPDAPPRLLPGGAEAVDALTFSGDERWLATGDAQGVVRLFDMGNLDAPPLELAQHADAINALAFSPDSTLLASGSVDTTTIVWRVGDGAGQRPTTLDDHQDYGFVRAVAFAPDGRHLVTAGGDGAAYLYDVADLDVDPVALLHEQDGFTAVAFSPDGRWLAIGSQGDTASLFDMAGDQPAGPIVLHHNGPVQSLDFSADSTRLATGSEDATIRLWELNPQDPARAVENPIELPQTGAVDVVRFSPTGTVLATGGQANLGRLYRIGEAGEDPVVLSGHEGPVTSLAFDGDSSLATGSVDGTVRLWALDHLDTRPQPLPSASATGAADAVPSALRALAFSPDGRLLATGAADKVVELWDVDDPDAAPLELPHDAIEEFAKAGVDALAFSPDGGRLATGGGDRIVRLWDLGAPAERPVGLPPLDAAVTSLAVSPDGHWLAAGVKDVGGQEAYAWVWDLRDLTAAPQALHGHDDEVTSVAFSPDGAWLVTGSRDGHVRRWPVADLTADPLVWPKHGPVTSVAISPDSARIAAGSGDGTVQVWDVEGDGADPLTLVTRGSVHGVAFGGSGRPGANLLVAALDGVESWDLEAPDPASAAMNPALLHAASPTVAVASGPSHGRFASAGEDGVARVWLPLDALGDLGCRAAGRNLTQQEWQLYLPGETYESTCPQWPRGQ